MGWEMNVKNYIVSLALILFIIPSATAVNYTAAVPYDFLVLPEQIAADTISFQMVAAYNNSDPIFMLNNYTLNGNKISILVDSFISSEGEPNITARPAQLTLINLSAGNYTVEVRERTLDVLLENTTFNIEYWGLLVNENDLIATIGVFKGGVENETLYLMPFPRLQVLPPGVFQHSNFWAPSNESFYLAVKFTNEGTKKEGMNFSLSSPYENISIGPRNCTIGTVNSSSYAFCVLGINNTNISQGIYGLEYGLRYVEGTTLHTKTGTMPMGVYELSEWVENNSGVISTHVRFLSPFNDTINYTAAGWTNHSLQNGSVWFPSNFSYTANYSNFTRQEPNSPLMNILVGAAAGAALCGGATAFEQWASGEEIRWDEVAVNAAKGAVGGALIAGTFGVAGTAGVGIMVKGAVVSGGLSATTEALDQHLSEGGVHDWGDVAVAGLTDGVFGAGLAGAPTMAGSYMATSRHVAAGGGVGKWAKVSELWHQGKKWEAAHKYYSMAPKLTRAQDVTSWYGYVGSLQTRIDIWQLRYALYQLFEDNFGTQNISIMGMMYLFHSPYSSEDFDGNGIPDLIELLDSSVSAGWPQYQQNAQSTGNIEYVIPVTNLSDVNWTFTHLQPHWQNSVYPSVTLKTTESASQSIHSDRGQEHSTASMP